MEAVHITKTCSCGRVHRSACTTQWQLDYANSQRGQLCDVCAVGRDWVSNDYRDDAENEFNQVAKELHQQQEADEKCRNM